MSLRSFSASRSFRVILLAFGVGTRGITEFLLLALLARLFTKADFAIYTQSMLVNTTLLPLLSLGLPTTMYLLLTPGGGHSQRRRAVLLENQIFLLLVGSLFVVWVWSGGNHFLASNFNNPDLAPSLNALAVYFLFSLPLLSFDGVLLVNNHVVQIIVFRLISQILLFSCGFMAALIWRDPLASLTVIAVGNMAVYSYGFWLMWRACGPGDWRPRWRSVRAQLGLGLPLLLATSLGTLQLNLDTWLVSLLDNPEKFAVFAVGATELPLIKLFTSAVTQVLMADCAVMFHENRHEDIARVIWRATRSNMIFLLPTMFFFLATAEEVVPLIFSNAYQESVQPFMLYLLIIPARFINYSSIEISSGKTYLVPTVFGINMILTAVLTVLMYGSFGYLAATYSYLAVTYLFAVPAHLLIFVRVLKLPLRRTFPPRDFFKAALAISLAAVVLLSKPLIDSTALVQVVVMGVLFSFALVGTFVILRVEIPLVSALFQYRAQRQVVS